MSISGFASDDRYLIGAFLQEYGPEPDARSDYLYHLLDLVEHTHIEGLNDTLVNEDAGNGKRGERAEGRPLRVIDM
jgi:hypothetical protein